MATKATITDVAHLAGVSIKTVSRVVNREAGVREETRARVQQAIDTLGYYPNQSARDLASARAHLICLIYEDPSDYGLPSAGYIIRLQTGVLRVCQRFGYELLVHPCSQASPTVGADIAAVIQRARPAGIILAAPLSNNATITRAISDSGTPMVRLSPGQKRLTGSVVVTNDREYSAEMTAYLASLGHRKIAFVNGHPAHKAVQLRLQGYKDGLAQSGLSFEEALVVQGDNSFGSGLQAGHELLTRSDRPTAIFAANDDMAVGVIRAANQLGVKIPEEISIAGCDDITLAEQVFPPLTTIRQPFSAMAEEATLMLVEGIEHREDARQHVVVPGKLKIRESTGPAPTH